MTVEEWCDILGFAPCTTVVVTRHHIRGLGILRSGAPQSGSSDEYHNNLSLTVSASSAASPVGPAVHTPCLR